MELKVVETLFKGVGVIIDDDVYKDETPAHQILKSLQEANIPMVIYEDIPNLSVIESFGNISFVILDWDFSTTALAKLKINEEESSDIVLPEGFREEGKRTILEFLKVLLTKVFAPVFVFTGQIFEDVRQSLMDEGLYQEGKPNRILLKSKDEIGDYNTLIKNIEEWLRTAPSAHVLKLWESEAVKSKNRMFLDLYSASPNWVSILLRILKVDAANNRLAVNQEFAEILDNNFINRISLKPDYYSVSMQEDNSNPDDIRTVLQGERYVTYDQKCLPDICYVGDVYRMNDDPKFPYRLNIRAQCDLSRDKNPKLYIIPGKAFPCEKVTTHPGILLTEKGEKNILQVDQDCYDLKELVENDNKRKDFNKKMKVYDNPVVFSYGDIIEKKTHSIIACVADETLIEFSFRDFEVIDRESIDITATRIGRLLPPYITKVQNAFASFMVRTGIMPIPKELIDRV